jgi:hypothetical protein
MKITVESTSKLIEFWIGSGSGTNGIVLGCPIPCRIWEGKTESGIEIIAYIPRVAVAEGKSPDIYRQFERELEETRKPSPVAQAIPLRMIL